MLFEHPVALFLDFEDRAPGHRLLPCLTSSTGSTHTRQKRLDRPQSARLNADHAGRASVALPG